MIRHAAALLAALSLAAPVARAAGTPAPKPAASSPLAVPPISNPVNLPPPKPVPPPNAPAAFDLGVWTVHASSLDANFKTGDFSTPNKIVMTRAGGDVSADRANGNYKKKTLFLNGNVVMHDAQGGAAGMGGPGGDQHTGGPSTLTADRAQIDGDAKLYKAIGNVHYVQGETVVTADNGTLNDTDHTLFLQGSVHIESGTRKMSAQTVHYNTTTGDAHAQGNVTMQFPSEFHRHLATPKPLNLPKHGALAPPSPKP
jgi:lipopolysaccharide assembly outer membrane protein LptD (OstA)